MTLFVSSYSDSFAPGTFLVHSGDSAKASSALQLLDTRTPDHDPGFVVFCPATAIGVIEKSDTRQRKKRLRKESALAVSINSRPSLPSWIGGQGTPDSLRAYISQLNLPRHISGSSCRVLYGR